MDRIPTSYIMATLLGIVAYVALRGLVRGVRLADAWIQRRYNRFGIEAKAHYESLRESEHGVLQGLRNDLAETRRSRDAAIQLHGEWEAKARRLMAERATREKGEKKGEKIKGKKKVRRRS
jgi:hypothetical protein